MRVIEIGSERTTASDNLGHHPNRKCAGANSWITNGDVRKFLVEQPCVSLNRLWRGWIVSADSPRLLCSLIKGVLLSEMNEGLNVRATDKVSIAVQCRIEIVDQTFLAHIVHDFTRSVVGPKTLAPVFLDQILEDLSEHFGVDGHFLLQRLSLIDGEVVLSKTSRILRWRNRSRVE
jgi:hypothetical protein